MNRITITQYFENYSDKAIQQMVDTCKGSPLYVGDSKVLLGTVVSGKRVPNKGIEYIVEMEVI